jgi:tetratricopeptide (TPR) repeat protein
MGHIKFGKKKTRYFTLTQKGVKYTKKMLKKLSDQKITLIQTDGTKEMITFKDIYPTLKYEEVCAGITEQDIYRAISVKRTLDIEKLIEIKRMRMVNYTSDTPMLMHFFGRRNELKTLKTWIDDKKGPNVISIHGMAGIGKTTLVTKLIEEYKGSRNIFWHNFHQMETPRGILSKLADFLDRLGYNHLDMYLKMNSSLDLTKVSSIIRKNVELIDSVLVFDDFQKSNDEIRDLIDYIEGILNSSSKTKLLIVSRELIPFYGRKDVLLRNNVAEMEIGGLDFASSKKLLKERGIDNKKHKDIYDLTQGNPLFLEFCESKNDLNKYLHDELFTHLKEDERNVLSMISIFRHPVPEEALNIYEDFDYGKLYDLSMNSLVKTDSNERFFLHDLIKQFYYKRLQSSKRKAYHLRAAKWYETKGAPIHQIEALYHYMESGNYLNAFSLVEKNHKTIIENGFAQELLIHLERFHEMKMDALDWAQILLIKGKASNIIGEWRKSLLYFSQINDIAHMYGNTEFKVKALYGSGQILEEQNQFEGAMNSFENCLKISDMNDYEYGKCNAYRGIGRVQWRKCHYEKAISSYEKCLEISNRIDDKDVLASTYIDLGNVYDEMGNTEGAIECYEKSIKILKKVDNKYETARAYSNLAITYRHLGEFHRAIDYYYKQLNIAENLKDEKVKGYGYAGLGYCLAKIKNIKDARAYGIRAENIATKIENENIMYQVNKTFALLSKEEKRWEEAVKFLEKNVMLVEKLQPSYGLSETHYELGLTFKEMGDSNKAEEHFNIATKLKIKMNFKKP